MGHGSYQPAPHHAICVTGLLRSYPEIKGNVVAALASLYSTRSLRNSVAIFGVRPVNDSWREVYETLPSLTNETQQRACGAKPPPWFSVYARSNSARAGFNMAFVMSLCDMTICLRELVEVYEANTMGGRRFRTLARLRLDLAWETPLRMPPGGLLPNTVYLPRMNAKSGMCDKFAIGSRRAMGVYLSRYEAFTIANRMYDKGGNATSAMADFACALTSAREDTLADAGLGLTVCHPRLTEERTAWQGSAIAPHGHQHRSLAPLATHAHDRRHFAMTSEGFLSWALWRQNVSIVLVQVPYTRTPCACPLDDSSPCHLHFYAPRFAGTTPAHGATCCARVGLAQGWTFCKYKDAMQAGNHTPRTCVPRMRRHVPCTSLVCPGSVVDCSCQGTPCTTYDARHKRNSTKWYCTDVAGTQLDNDGQLY